MGEWVLHLVLQTSIDVQTGPRHGLGQTTTNRNNSFEIYSSQGFDFEWPHIIGAQTRWSFRAERLKTSQNIVVAHEINKMYHVEMLNTDDVNGPVAVLVSKQSMMLLIALAYALAYTRSDGVEMKICSRRSIGDCGQGKISDIIACCHLIQCPCSACLVTPDLFTRPTSQSAVGQGDLISWSDPCGIISAATLQHEYLQIVDRHILLRHSHGGKEGCKNEQRLWDSNGWTGNLDYIQCELTNWQ